MKHVNSPGAAVAAMMCALACAAPAAAELPASVCTEANVDAFLEQDARPKQQIDKRAFYARLRTFSNFDAVYSESGQHYPGTDAILDHWNERPELKDTRWLAYILATAFHETAFRMFPVRETLASTDAGAVQALENYYQRRGSSGPIYWRPVEETGQSYFGRGYVQLTWDYNYQRADMRADMDPTREADRERSFYWNPSQVLEPDASIAITYSGMVYGWYTGRCMLRYISPNREAEWSGARRVINGLDRADDIGELAVQFLVAIEDAAVEVEPPPPPQPPAPPAPPLGAEGAYPGWLGWLFPPR